MRDKISCPIESEKTYAIEYCTKTQPCTCAKHRFIKELLKNTPPERSHFVHISEGLFINEELHKNSVLNLCKAIKIKKFFNQGSKLPSPSGYKWRG